MLLITDDDRVALPVTADDLTAIVALTEAETVLVWEPTNRTLIAANIIGEMPWIQQAKPGDEQP